MKAVNAACDMDVSLSRIGLHNILPNLDVIALKQARVMIDMARCEALTCERFQDLEHRLRLAFQALAEENEIRGK